MKYWLVATYKINEIKQVEANLKNQGFDYYLPKIFTKKPNCKPHEEAMFPGYIFINASIGRYSSVKYTKGIKNIIKFGENISYMTDSEIKSITKAEKLTMLEPILSDIKIGQEVDIKSGAFKGNIGRICALPSGERVGILLHFLGAKRKINILKKDILF